MQASTQDKQRYLRQHILESHFDPEEFVHFVKEELAIEDLDLEHLTMKTIQNIVNKFKSEKHQHNQLKDTNNKKQINGRKAKIDYQKNGEVYDYQFEEICQCISTDKFPKTLQVFIPNFQIKQIQGIFFSIGSRTQIWYSLKTNLTKYPIKRLQEDFEWLSNSVTRLFPFLAIPELLPISREDQGNHQKRRKELETYMQILASRDQLKQSTLLKQFLTIPPEKMQRIKKNTQSLQTPKDVQTIQNQRGQVVVSITNKLRDYTQTTNTYNRKIQVLHESISASLQKVSQFLNTVFAEVNKIVNYFAQIHDNYNQMNNHFPQHKVPEYNDILININNLFNVFSLNLSTTSKIMQNNLQQFYKLSLNYDRNLSKLYRTLADTEKQYLYSKINLHRKKQRLYPDITRWQLDQKLIPNRKLSKEQAFDLMLPRQSLQQNQKRLWLGYLYKNYTEEFNRYIKFEVKRYVDVFCTFASDLLLNNRTYVEELTKFIEESKRIILT